jgi:Rrf2 family protein
MRISSKGDYGLRALFDLAQHVGEGPVQSEAIATRQGIPVSYLNQLLITLRRGGLVVSIRGAQGGYYLARPPQEITLLDILSVLEGPLLQSEAQRDSLHSTAPEDYAQITELWGDLRGQLEAMLSAINLEDLLQRKREHDGTLMYYI